MGSAGEMLNKETYFLLGFFTWVLASPRFNSISLFIF